MSLFSKKEFLAFLGMYLIGGLLYLGGIALAVYIAVKIVKAAW